MPTIVKRKKRGMTYDDKNDIKKYIGDYDNFFTVMWVERTTHPFAFLYFYYYYYYTREKKKYISTPTFLITYTTDQLPSHTIIITITYWHWNYYILHRHSAAYIYIHTFTLKYLS